MSASDDGAFLKFQPVATLPESGGGRLGTCRESTSATATVKAGGVRVGKSSTLAALKERLPACDEPLDELGLHTKRSYKTIV